MGPLQMPLSQDEVVLGWRASSRDWVLTGETQRKAGDDGAETGVTPRTAVPSRPCPCRDLCLPTPRG